MVICRSASGVSFFCSWGPQHLCYYSRSLVRPTPSEKELWNLHHRYDASPRCLYTFYDRPGLYENMINEDMSWLEPQDFTELLRDVPQPNHSDFLISTGLSAINRTMPERRFVSSYVLTRIYDQVLKNWPRRRSGSLMIRCGLNRLGLVLQG